MADLKRLVDGQNFGDNSICAIELETYKKNWGRVSFLAKEKDGQPTRNFVPMKSGQFIEQQLYLAAGLLESGVRKGDFVAVYSPNSLRHAAEIYAILSIGAVYIPIYPSLTEEIILYLLSHSGARVMFTGGLGQYQRSIPILKRVKSPLTKLIVDFPVNTSENSVITFDSLLRIGEKSNRVEDVLHQIKNTTREDLASLVYTAGTMGIPKAVMLTHGNFLAQAPLAHLFDITPNDTRHSHLPFSHVFGLSSDLFATALIGNKIAISHTFDTEEIVTDIDEIKPTVMCSVPRMYEKLFIHVVHVIERFGAFKKFRYTFALNVGKELFMRKAIGKRIPVTVRFMRLMMAPIYRKIRKIIGMDRMRILFSGGDPLSVEVAYFFGSLGLEILEGYGLTETSPVINVNLPGKSKPGTVGPPLKGADEKISDEGEILVRGPMVCKGYYNYQEEDASEFFTSDGYFRTGDVGTFTSDGYLMITGRLKDLIITSGGKNIAPLPLELKFTSDEYIESFCIVGDKRKYLAALVVPDFDRLREFAKSKNIEFVSNEELVKNPEVLAFMKKRIEEISESQARYEQIKKFTLLSHSFSVETGELTLTYKFKRRVIQDKYKDIIDKMYPESSILG
jgi:long-chain acyl-CoA synthetase